MALKRLKQPDPLTLKEGKLTEESSKRLYDQLRDTTSHVNELRATQDGSDGAEITCPTSANTEFIVRHELGRVPIGVQLMRKDRAVDVYDSRPDAWTANSIFLKATVASAVITLKLW